MSTELLPVPVLAVSGPVGVVKTTVLVEIHDVLVTQDVPHACIERDATRGYVNEDAALENLASVWANYLAAGAERLVVAGVVERAADIAGYRRAIPGAQITVCRLRASEETRVARLCGRETGAGLRMAPAPHGGAGADPRCRATGRLRGLQRWAAPVGCW
jgi:hypothetical protein